MARSQFRCLMNLSATWTALIPVPRPSAPFPKARLTPHSKSLAMGSHQGNNYSTPKEGGSPSPVGLSTRGSAPSSGRERMRPSKIGFAPITGSPPSSPCSLIGRPSVRCRWIQRREVTPRATCRPGSLLIFLDSSIISKKLHFLSTRLSSSRVKCLKEKRCQLIERLAKKLNRKIAPKLRKDQWIIRSLQSRQSLTGT